MNDRLEEPNAKPPLNALEISRKRLSKRLAFAQKMNEIALLCNAVARTNFTMKLLQYRGEAFINDEMPLLLEANFAGCKKKSKNLTPKNRISEERTLADQEKAHMIKKARKCPKTNTPSWPSVFWTQIDEIWQFVHFFLEYSFPVKPFWPMKCCMSKKNTRRALQHGATRLSEVLISINCLLGWCLKTPISELFLLNFTKNIQIWADFTCEYFPCQIFSVSRSRFHTREAKPRRCVARVCARWC